MNEDITFCNKQKCKIMSCERNPNNIRIWSIPHSYAELENTEYCKKKERNKDENR